ncbi:MAG: sensor histidine kinase [Planctomycetota bacterium]|jgi:signal transduction histidine kinase
MPYFGFRLFRRFYLFSTVSIIVILFVAGLGLRHVLRNLIVLEAEDDAIHFSTVTRDYEIPQYIEQRHSKNDPFLTIPPAELPELDRRMRTLITQFHIVKIKIYNTEPRVIYSTDQTIIGRLDLNNASLSKALAGTPVSKHEHKDEVWDLDDEKRINVEIVETYVPVYDTDGKIIGSFEIYKDITPNLAMADRIWIRSWGTLAVTVLGVFAALMFVIRRAAKMIKVSTVNLTTTNEQLQQEVKDRKRLEKELLSIIEQERQRIGLELHDSIGQQLTGIAFMMEVLGEKLSDKSLTEQVSYTERINSRVGKATEQTRNLAKGLHPIDLERNGLVSAIQELASNTEQLFNVSCILKSENAVSINDVSVAMNLYRIAQEAITNAIKHGHAKNIKIGLIAEHGCLTLTVENDGLDFPAGANHSDGMGLRIMRYRAEVINSSLEVCKGADGGTIVTCKLLNEEYP